MSSPRVASAGALLALAILGVACHRAPTRILTLSGSTSVQPLAEKWAEAYHARHPELTIAVQGGGSTAGVQATISGAAQIGMVSRALTSSERPRVRDILVARDGIALVVHPSNPLSDISLNDVRSIYASGVRSWPKRAGGQPITVITREEGSGTRTAFESLVMGGLPISASALVSDSTGAVRQMVSTDPAAIGYISIGLIDASIKPLRLDGTEPNERNIDSGAYRLVRPFLFTVRREQQPATEFIAWVIGPEGTQLTRQEGMLPARAQEARAER